MSDKYYVGSYREDGLYGPNRGWIVGKFKDSKPRKTDDVEIRYWEFAQGSNDHPVKTSSIIECTFILQGRTKALVDGKEIILNAGDYIVIEPGTPNNLVAE